MVATIKLGLTFWTNASSKRKRIYSIIAVLIVAIIVTVIGSFIPLSHQDANSISQGLNQTLNQNKANDSLTQYIFMNNFQICLLMFIPVVGAGLGLFILFDTGIALGAIAATQGYPVWFALISEFLTPIFWLEFAAYAIAMAESVWLFRRLLQGQWRNIRGTIMYIGICSVILLVSAYIEVWLISTIG